MSDKPGNKFYCKSVDSSGTEAMKLTMFLYKELELLYGKGTIESFSEENKNFIKFIIAEDEAGNATACGALKHFAADTAEIKRMFVKKEFRGMGISKLVLRELESTASEQNYKTIVLETGLKQPAAMKLYETNNYSRIKCYGKYADDPESVCYEKILIQQQ